MFLRAAGVRLRPLGAGWVGYASLSRESHLLNDESVAVIEQLDEQVPMSARAVAEQLSEESGMTADDLEQTLQDAWQSLAIAGLIRIVTAPTPPSSS